jgi:hypothetical protein
MRAYSCIDTQGRWTEIPTQVQISTFLDAHPPQPSPRSSNVAQGVRPNVASNFSSRILDVIPDVIDEYSNRASPSDATTSSKSMSRSDNTACAAPPAPSLARGSRVASDVLDIVPRYSNHASPGDATACAASPAQPFNATEDEYADPEDDDCDVDQEDGAENDDDPEDAPDDDNKNPKNKSHVDSLEETTACAAPPAQTASGVRLNSKDRGRSVTATARSVTLKARSRIDATVCAASPAQLPRDVVRGQNPNDRSPSDRTDCAALPAQPAPRQKPKPDADGIIWHPRPGYPNQEISEPNAEGLVAYKIHITPPGSQLPSRETDARRAAELIYRSVIKKYGNQ